MLRHRHCDCRQRAAWRHGSTFPPAGGCTAQLLQQGVIPVRLRLHLGACVQHLQVGAASKTCDYVECVSAAIARLPASTRTSVSTNNMHQKLSVSHTSAKPWNVMLGDVARAAAARRGSSSGASAPSCTSSGLLRTAMQPSACQAVDTACGMG